MMLRSLRALLVAAVVALPICGAASPSAVPAPVPSSAGLTGSPAERYAASRADIEAAARSARAYGARSRAGVLDGMADPGRQFLFFDGRAGGRSAEVFGDLALAREIAILVPGSGISIDKYRRFRAGAQALQHELGDGGAVVAWLGYEPPAAVSPSILTSAVAAEAAPELSRFAAGLRADTGPDTRISLLCHSYGSVVCAHAAAGLDVDAIVLYGSPGVGFANAQALRSSATIWAGRGADDWISGVPHIQIGPAGFGADPVSPGFGARIFAAGNGGHNDYLKPGSAALSSIARIVTADGDGNE